MGGPGCTWCVNWEVWAYAWTLTIAAIGLGIVTRTRPENTAGRRAGFRVLVSGAGAFLILGLVVEAFIFGTMATF